MFCIRIDGFNMTKLKVLTRINMFTLEYDYNECVDRNNDNWNWCEVSGKMSRIIESILRIYSYPTTLSRFNIVSSSLLGCCLVILNLIESRMKYYLNKTFLHEHTFSMLCTSLKQTTKLKVVDATSYNNFNIILGARS